MRESIGRLLVVVAALPAIAVAGDAVDEAIRKDRKQIQGAWQVTSLTISGDKSQAEDVRKITVVNGDDGTWSVRSEGKEISRGTSTFDPAKTPKTVDFTPTDGGGLGDRFLGIYQLSKDARKLCFAPTGKDRPTEFSSTPENQHILVEFKRVKSHPLND